MSGFSFLVEETGERLDQFLSKQTGQSRAFVQEQIKLGGIFRNQAVILKASQKLKAGDAITGSFRLELRMDLIPVAYPLEIVYEDEAFLVVNKPQGMVVHPAAGHYGETLVHYLLHYLQEAEAFTSISPTRPGIVHRLDRGTSGLILVAKSRKVQELLSKKFKDRDIKKTYEAIAWGKMKPEGTFKSSIGRDTKERKKMSSRTQKGREAVTAWKRTLETNHFTHVDLFPQTGRTHQLRVHLSENGNPIVGDALYGKSSRTKRVALAPEVEKRLESVKYTFLHARSLNFSHPLTLKPMSLEAKRPQAFEEFLELIRKVDA